MSEIRSLIKNVVIVATASITVQIVSRMIYDVMFRDKIVRNKHKKFISRIRDERLIIDKWVDLCCDLHTSEISIRKIHRALFSYINNIINAHGHNMILRDIEENIQYHMNFNDVYHRIFYGGYRTNNHRTMYQTVLMYVLESYNWRLILREIEHIRDVMDDPSRAVKQTFVQRFLWPIRANSIEKFVKNELYDDNLLGLIEGYLGYKNANDWI